LAVEIAGALADDGDGCHGGCPFFDAVLMLNGHFNEKLPVC
jgi:hypothetical protein